MKFSQLGKLWDSGYTCVALLCPLIERIRILQLVGDIAARKYTPTYLWNFGEKSFVTLSKELTKANCGEELQTAVDALDFVISCKLPGLFVLENIQSLLLGDGERVLQISERLIKIAQQLEGTDKYLILFSTEERELPKKLQGVIPEIWVPLPSQSEISEIVDAELSRLAPDINETHIDKAALVSAASGLNCEEIKKGLQFWKEGIFDCNIVQSLLAYKIEKFQELGLDFKGQPLIEDFGGLDRLKTALEDVKFEFSLNARRYNIPLPKGWLLVGPPGTGKTFAAQVCAYKLRSPLISVDVGGLVKGGVPYLKKLLRRVEACGRVVLYFDEFDKLFSTSSDSGEVGASRQILGVLLTWLQDKTSETFVIATLNRLDALPPELTRAGRFDRIFYVGFPQAVERKQITQLHAARFDSRYVGANSPLTDSEWRIWLSKTLNCTGAEISRMVEFAARKKAKLLSLTTESIGVIEVNLADLLEERSRLTPLYARDTDRILAMENSARYVAEPASSPDTSQFAPAITTFWGEELVENSKG